MEGWGINHVGRVVYIFLVIKEEGGILRKKEISLKWDNPNPLPTKIFFKSQRLIELRFRSHEYPPKS